MKRISKATARMLYNSGSDVVILPSKLAPRSVWYATPEYNLYRECCSFDYLCDQITYYNCNNASGNRLHYYVND